MDIRTCICACIHLHYHYVVGFPEYMSFPRFRRRYECLVPSDDRPKGVVDEKAVSNGQFMYSCLKYCVYLINSFTHIPYMVKESCVCRDDQILHLVLFKG